MFSYFFHQREQFTFPCYQNKNSSDWWSTLNSISHTGIPVLGRKYYWNSKEESPISHLEHSSTQFFLCSQASPWWAHRMIKQAIPPISPPAVPRKGRGFDKDAQKSLWKAWRKQAGGTSKLLWTRSGSKVNISACGLMTSAGSSGLTFLSVLSIAQTTVRQTRAADTTVTQLWGSVVPKSGGTWPETGWESGNQQHLQGMNPESRRVGLASKISKERAGRTAPGTGGGVRTWRSMDVYIGVRFASWSPDLSCLTSTTLLFTHVFF